MKRTSINLCQWFLGYGVSIDSAFVFRDVERDRNRGREEGA